MHYQLEKYKLIGEYFNYPFNEAVTLLKEISTIEEKPKRAVSEAQKRQPQNIIKTTMIELS